MKHKDFSQSNSCHILKLNFTSAAVAGEYTVHFKKLTAGKVRSLGCSLKMAYAQSNERKPYNKQGKIISEFPRTIWSR